MEIIEKLATEGYQFAKQKIIYNNNQYSMKQLEEKARVLASKLKGKGVRFNKEQKVLIVLRRSPALVAAHYATFLAGGVIVAVDPEAPVYRLKQIIEDIAPSVIITHKNLSYHFRSMKSALLIVDEHLYGLETSSVEINKERRNIDPKSAAYIVYTSGTTGRPKGVVIEWQSLAHLLKWHVCTFQLDSFSCVSLTSSPGFDASIWEIWGALAARSSIHVASDDERLVPERLKDSWREYGVTHTFVSTPIAERLIELEWKPEDTGLKYMLTGGDRLTKFPPKKLPFQLVNNYGPSEGCVVTTSGVISPQSTDRNKSPHLGTPLPYHECFILDEKRNPVKRGREGILWISGPGLAREYLNRPDETAEKFCLIEVQGRQVRAYNTGDVISIDENGRYHFHGRNDTQVNINGVRIELGEIESVLLEHPSVSQAVTLPIIIGSKTVLTASVVPYGKTCDTDQLIKYLSSKLPKAMIPSQIIKYDSLPLTINGKIDREKLGQHQKEEFMRKQNENKSENLDGNDKLQTIISIFADTLGLPCSAHSDIFSVGGNSLHAAQIASQLSKQFGVVCKPSDVLKNKTPSQLADLLAVLPSHKKITMTDNNNEDWFPVTPMQRGLWYLWRSNPENAFYNVGAAFVIKGQFDEKAFIEAWTETLSSHPALRLTFRENIETQEIQQQVREIQEMDLRQRIVRTSVDSTSTAYSLMTRIFRQPFDLENDWLFRGALIHTENNKTFFLLAAHHIACDGLSLQNILKELAVNYEQIRSGLFTILSKSKGHKDCEIYLRQFVDLQQNAATDPKLLSYWKEQSKSFSLAEFPVSQQNDEGMFDGEILECESEIGLGEKLEVYCKERKVSRFTVLLASWIATIGRFCRQKKLTVGVPFHGRSEHEYIGKSGMFVNLVPVTIFLDERKTFHELVDDVTQKIRQALSYGDFSIVDIAQNMIRKDRFDVVNITFSEKLPLSFPLSSAQVTYLELDTGGARFPLSGFFHVQTGRIAGHVEYTTSIFNKTIVQDLVNAYFAALENMIDLPDQLWTSAYPKQSIFQPDEETVRSWFSQAVPLHQLFERAVEQYTNYIAVKDSKHTWTFEELNQKAELIAARLQQFGVKKGDYVPLLMYRKAEMVAAVLGVLKAGAVYVPLDPESPYKRNQQLLEYLCPKIVLQTVEVTIPSGEWSREVVEDLVQKKEIDWEYQPIDIEVNDAAYLMFTSGSTGEPKGVLCPHAGASLRVLWQQKKGHLMPGDRVLGKTPYTFDVSVWEMFFSLASGATLVLAPPLMHRNPEELIRFIKDEKITLCHFVPSMLYPILDELQENEEISDQFQLKFVHTSGESLPTYLAQRLKDCLPNVTVLNLYGPTEAGIEVTCCKVEDKVNIGAPLPYVSLRVVDEDGNPVPLGFPGELVLGGPSLAKRYINNEEETRRAFITESQDRYYKTGDLVRLERDGSIDFIGRLDAQVKIKGVRIEPGEIEAYVTELDGIQEAAVVIGNRKNGEQSLVCFYVEKQGVSMTSQEIKEHLLAYLPQIYLPALFIKVDMLPLTKSGKRDRKWLSKKATTHLNQKVSKTYKSPQTKVEKIIAQVWKEVLNEKRVGLDENFFELGGDSIKSLQIITKLKNYGIKLKPQDFISYPTIGEQAWLAEESKEKDNEIAVTTEKQSFESKVVELPLTPLQSVMLMETLKDPDSNAYWQIISYLLPETTSMENIHIAWNKTVEANPVLRTRFIWQSLSEPKQVIQSEAIQIKEIDWNQLGNQWDTIEDWYYHEVNALKTQELKTLQQVYVIHNWEEEGNLLFVWIHHHILLDGWSLAQCLGDFFQVLENPRVELIERPTMEGYFKWTRSEEYKKKCSTFWRNMLQGVKAAETLHIEKQTSPVSSSEFRFIDKNFGSEAAHSLKRFCQEYQVTPSSVLLTLWSLIIKRYQSRSEILVGTTFANRPHQIPDVEKMSGMLINTLPVKVDVKPGMSIVDLCQQTMRRVSQVSEFSGIPYSDLLKLAKLPGDARLFQSTLIFQNFSGSLEESNSSARLVHSLGTSSDPLSLTLDVQDSDILIRVGWDQQLYYEEDVIALVQLLQECLENLGDISKLDAITFSVTARERQMLDQYLQCPYSLNDYRWSVELLFQPGQESKIAITDGENDYSYMDIVRYVNRLAVFLQQQGVQKGDTVALVGKKGVEVAIAMMAVWKLGAAWCAINEDFPENRKQRTLKMLQPKVVLNLSQVSKHIENERFDIFLPTEYFQQNDIAYFIATSGSTGEPKIVALEAGGLCQITESWKLYYEFDSPQNVLQLGSWTSDVYLGDLIKAWSTGGTLIVCPEKKRIDMEHLIYLTEKYDVTLIESTPILVQEFVSYAYQTGQRPQTLQTLIVGADTFRIEEKQTLCEMLWPGVRLYNGYGLSECTIESVVYPCELQKETSQSGLCPIGRPLPGNCLRIVNEQGQDVPPGVIGELHIGSTQVARGYVSEEGWVTNSFYELNGVRYFQTGDLVRLNWNGELEFFGRRDQQVKIRGHRLELGEVENMLLSISCVNEAFVAPINSKRGIQLIAFASQNESNDEESIMKELKKRLPEFAIPQKIILLKKLPRNANGKIDRPSLIQQAEEWVKKMERQSVEKIEFTGNTTEVVRRIWEHLLNKPVQMQRSFFDQGGHSLLVLELFQQLKKVLPKDSFVIGDLFRYPTIEGFVSEIESRRLERNKDNSVQQKKLVLKGDRLELLRMVKEGVISIDEAYRLMDKK